MKKKTIIIALVILVFVFIVFLAIFKKPSIPYINDCKMRCENYKPIPCDNDNDCEADPMMEFCNQGVAVFKNGFSGYCKKGYCQSYGCGGVPAID